MTPWTVAHQAPLSMGFPRQESWRGLPFLPPGDLLNPGIKPMFPACPALADGFFTIAPPRKPYVIVVVQLLSHVWLLGLQHARLLCTSLSLGVCSNSCPFEGGNRTGFILKAGLHLGPDCGLWAICPVSMEMTYQWKTRPLGWRSLRTCT